MTKTRLILACVALAGCGSERHPKLLDVMPKTLCANNDSDLELIGADLDTQKVEIGIAPDMGPATMIVAAATLTGTGAMLVAHFTAHTLTPMPGPYDVIYTDKSGQQLVLSGAVTVVPGISISAVDPGSAYNGVDFPTSIYGTGMGGVQKISITSNGITTDLAGVTAVDGNRADAVVPKGLLAGTYAVTVTDTDGCTATLSGALTIVADLTVSVCAVDPAFGYVQEDTDVTLTATSDGTAGGATCGGKAGKLASTPRAWLVIGGTLKPLRNVSFVSAGSLTGTVPAGLPVGGPYDLLVQNPDGAVGLLSGAFKVVDMPVPQLTSIDPGTVVSNFSGTLKIFGKNFRAPVKLELYNQSTAAKTVMSPTVVNAGEVDVAFDPTALGLSVGAYVVRLTDTDQTTFGEYSVLAIISASGNVGNWTDVTETQLPNPTMRHGAAGGQVSPAARYLYVVGGDSGGATPTRYDATQIASLDKFGNIGAWFIGHDKLPEARTQLQVVAASSATGAGGYLYAIGGNTAAGTIAKVSRAKILLPAEAPVVAPTTVTLGGSLPKGTWYYRVSAVLDGNDPTNPLGETLPSEEATAHTVDGSQVQLAWATLPGAASYRVYRTGAVNGTSKDEVLLKDAVTETRFVDDGTITPGSDRPFVQGELGVWMDVAMLAQPRRGFGAALAHDPAGNAYLYAIGGDKGTALVNAVLDTDVYNTYEVAPLTDGGMTLGAFTEDLTNTLANKRTRLQSPVGEHATSPTVGSTTAYVYAVGGFDGTTLVDSYQAGTVQGGAGAGKLVWSPAVTSNKILQALQSMVVADWLFALGGEGVDGSVVKQAASNSYTTPPAFGPTLNANSAASTDLSTTQTIASYAGLVLNSAHFWLVGGTTDGVNALKRVWSNVY